jgi:hypothetical protein
MMPGRFAQFLVWLLVASLAHLPLPVWDGDDVGSRGLVAAWTGGSPRDVDLILLGCDAPDDCDDGPTDDDPDDGTLDSGLGPAYLTAGAVVPCGARDASPAVDGFPAPHTGPADLRDGHGAFPGCRVARADRLSAGCVLRL